MTVACSNPDCSEYELPKTIGFELLPGETVTCGGCGQDCAEVESAAGPEPEPA